LRKFPQHQQPQEKFPNMRMPRWQCSSGCFYCHNILLHKLLNSNFIFDSNAMLHDIVARNEKDSI
jgi:hypothetical protein